MIHSILQIIVFHLLFLAMYELFLKRETFFNGNRAYLLLTSLVAVILPFVKFGFIQQNIPQLHQMELSSIVLGTITSEVGNTTLSINTILPTIWYIGMGVSSLIFSVKLLNLYRLRSTGTSEDLQGIKMTIVPNSDVAFSFLNRIYLGEQVSEENKTEIIAHEKIHIQQKHSWDLLYFELLRIAFWFNPFVYVYQNKIATLHEYIADSKIIYTTDRRDYYLGLLASAFQTEKISFVNTFFKESLIKKRIIMLQKTKSHKMKLAKYFLVLPLMGLMLTYSAQAQETKVTEVKEEKIVEIQNLSNQKDVQEIDEVPFAIIDKIPVYPGCVGDNIELKNCMSLKVSEVVTENFNVELASELGLEGRQRIKVDFIIDESGNVTSITARAPHPALEEEAIRVVNGLPKMKPGMHEGKKVKVLYSLPIVFDIQK